MDGVTNDALYLVMDDDPRPLGGAGDATVWDNAHRDRTDLPRTLPEFSVLTVHVVDRVWTPPVDGSGVLFRRTPRPGQGLLTGGETRGLLLVLVSPRDPDQAQALRDWADFIHIRHIAAAAIPGFTMITPYEHATSGVPRFLHLYEMDTDDAEKAFTAMPGLVAERIGTPGSDAWNEWAGHPQLRIDYVNTFVRR
jgi:hypothetical protein